MGVGSKLYFTSACAIYFRGTSKLAIEGWPCGAKRQAAAPSNDAVSCEDASEAIAIVAAILSVACIPGGEAHFAGQSPTLGAFTLNADRCRNFDSIIGEGAEFTAQDRPGLIVRVEANTRKRTKEILGDPAANDSVTVSLLDERLLGEIKLPRSSCKVFRFQLIKRYGSARFSKLHKSDRSRLQAARRDRRAWLGRLHKRYFFRRRSMRAPIVFLYRVSIVDPRDGHAVGGPPHSSNIDVWWRPEAGRPQVFQECGSWSKR